MADVTTRTTLAPDDVDHIPEQSTFLPLDIVLPRPSFDQSGHVVDLIDETAALDRHHDENLADGRIPVRCILRNVASLGNFFTWPVIIKVKT